MSHCSFSRSSCRRLHSLRTSTYESKARPRPSGAPPLRRSTATTAKDALEQASIAGEFYYHITFTSFGPYVDQIGRYAADSNSGWVFKVNNVSPPVGADQVTLADGDNVLWYYATFGPNGGPPTLSLASVTGGCYRVTAYDDAGKSTTVEGLVVHIGSKQSIPRRPARRSARARIRACWSGRPRRVRCAPTP